MLGFVTCTVKIRSASTTGRCFKSNDFGLIDISSNVGSFGRPIASAVAAVAAAAAPISAELQLHLHLPFSLLIPSERK